MFNVKESFDYNFDNKEDLILRDYLALERTRLANERTLMAYTRSSLYMLLGGIGVLQLVDFADLQWIGYLSILLSIVFFVVGLFRFYKLKKRIAKYYQNK